MQPTLMLCRDREAHHRALAGAAILDNVKAVANAAAAAWAKEGVAAGLREDRKARTLAFNLAHTASVEASCHDIAGFSENPDRGFASAT